MLNGPQHKAGTDCARENQLSQLKGTHRGGMQHYGAEYSCCSGGLDVTSKMSQDLLQDPMSSCSRLICIKESGTKINEGLAGDTQSTFVRDAVEWDVLDNASKGLHSAPAMPATTAFTISPSKGNSACLLRAPAVHSSRRIPAPKGPVKTAHGAVVLAACVKASNKSVGTHTPLQNGLAASGTFAHCSSVGCTHSQPGTKGQNMLLCTAPHFRSEAVVSVLRPSCCKVAAMFGMEWNLQ